MHAFDFWVSTRGHAVALLLDERRAPICEHATARFAAEHATLMMESPRPDAEAFQKLAFRETPRRFHRLLQVALRFQTLTVIEREYRWAWGILPRYGITVRHMQRMVNLYFEGSRVHTPLDIADRPYFALLEATVQQMIERSAPVDFLRAHQAHLGHYQNGNGIKH